MFPLTIYDANNWARRQLEAGRSVRDCFEHVRTAPSPAIVVWDGDNSTKLRRAIYPEYKKQRPAMREDLRQQFRFLEALIHLTHVTSIKVDGIEADDVIAHLANEWKVGPVTVFSNDRDLLQIQSVQLNDEVKLACPRRYLRHFKTLVGDTADNIPGIPNFGDKSFEKIPTSYLDTIEVMLTDGNADVALIGLLEPYCNSTTKKWLNMPGNIEQLYRFWEIIGFLRVPERKLNTGTTIGRNVPEQADEILRSVFQ